MCRQQANCSSYVDEVVLGTKGRAQILANRIDGENRWHYEGPNADMYDIEHVELFRSIREGRPINDGHYMSNSTMIGIMGRMYSTLGRLSRGTNASIVSSELAPRSMLGPITCLTAGCQFQVRRISRE